MTQPIENARTLHLVGFGNNTWCRLSLRSENYTAAMDEITCELCREMHFSYIMQCVEKYRSLLSTDI